MLVKHLVAHVVVALLFLAIGYGMASADRPELALPFGPVAQERSSPSNWIAEEDIQLFEDRIVIALDDPQWAVFEDTNSMDPVLDSGAHGLQRVPEHPDELHVGDIISFSRPGTAGIVIHSIIAIGRDAEGWSSVPKRHTTPGSDGKVRFTQVHRVLVGVLY